MPKKKQKIEEKDEEPTKKLKQTSISSFFISSTPKVPKVKADLGDGIWSKDKILISAWNVNGMRAQFKKPNLKDYLSQTDPDIFCMNETKIDQAKFDEINTDYFPKSYHQYYNFCKPPFSGYSGVSIFSKVIPISVVEDLGVFEHDQEGRVLTVEFETFYLVCTYIPNAGDGLKRLDYKTKDYSPALYSMMNTLRLKKPVIWTGDLNVAHQEIDLANPKTNTKTAGFTLQERDSFSGFLEQGWIDTFRHLYPSVVKYSWWSMRTGARAKGVGWRIDYAVVSDDGIGNVVDSIIRDDIHGSDHCPVELIYQIKKL